MSNVSNSIVVISCLSEDEDENDNNINSRDASSQKENIENDHGADDDDDDEIEVVDKADAVTTAKTTTAATTAANDDNDEELQIVGTANEQRFPHSRQDCLEFRYAANTNNTGGGTSNGSHNGNPNAKFCKLCYCYVCDKPASECDNWAAGERGVCSDATTNAAANVAEPNDSKKKASNSSTEPHNNHCNATDKKSPITQLWKNMRKAIKEGRDPSQVSNCEEVAGGSSMDALQQMISNYASYMPNGGVASRYMPGGGVASRARERERHRMSAMARGGARQRRSYNTDDSVHGRGGSSSAGMYGSVTAEAAASASATIPASGGRSRSAARSVASRKRNRSSSGSEGRARPAPHDHRQRIRTQQMLEDLYK